MEADRQAALGGRRWFVAISGRTRPGLASTPLGRRQRRDAEPQALTRALILVRSRPLQTHSAPLRTFQRPRRKIPKRAA